MARESGWAGVAFDDSAQPVLAVSVAVVGQASPVLYAGGAPGGNSGVMEVEDIVPAGAVVGSNAVTVTVGTVGSQANVTIVVKQERLN